MNSFSKISLIIPCFNEEDGLLHFYETLLAKLPKSYSYEILFVDDGSTDQTLTILKKIAELDSQVCYLSFSRNFGHQNALKAGYDYATGDCAISLDADLQHPPELISTFIKKWEQGFDIVNSVRKDHTNISYSKKLSSKLFYLFINKLSDVKIGKGMADFRLIDRKVLDQLKLFHETHIFFRGIVPWLGFKQINIDYQAAERYSGQTKYTFKKMIHFASDGVTSFSVKPLRYSIYLGLLFAAIAFIYLFYAIYVYFFTEQAVAGWTSLIVSIAFFGGLNLIMLGIIGEYLGKLFIENKKRPSYIIRESNLSSNSDR